jgi:alanine racemase
MNNEYHRVYARIDLDAIKFNMTSIRNHVNDNDDNNKYDVIKNQVNQKVKVMAVIKADGYGHGAIPIGRELEKLGVDYIAIAIYQEGVQLRKEGIKTPILVLGNTPNEAYDKLIEYDLTQTIYSIHMGKELETFAKAYNKIVKIHLKIDTGMGRIGLKAIHQPVEKVINSIKELYSSKYLLLEGIYTHFSKADEEDKSYTNMQIEVFDNIINALSEEDMLPEFVHASNSAGLIGVRKARYNMVRAGISLYGLFPSRQVEHVLKLKPAMSIISRVVFIKEVEKGEAISYGGTYITDKPSRIATIPIGYADGYSRALSNKGKVVIHGKYAPIIGRICMDQFMVDVTHIENVVENDEVYLIGGIEDATVSVEEIADLMQTINYEVVCLIGKRVPRVYVKENEVVEAIDYF